jgi:type IV secretion system protein VirB5
VKLKNKWVACLIASALVNVNAHAGGIPVIDVASIAHALTMVEQLKRQVTQMESQYAAISGARNLGQILNNPSLRTYLPDEWVGVYDKVKQGQLSGISSAARDIARQEGYDPNATGGQLRYQNTIAANKAMNQQAYAQTLQRLNNIQALMQQANTTPDAKASADLQNRIAAENAMIQNEQTRLNLMAQLQQAELQMSENQRRAEFKKRMIE